MKRELSRRATLFALVLGGIAPVAAIPAQDRSPTDRSLGASLLAVSLPGPSAPRLRRPDSTKSESVARFEATYGRAFTGDQIGGVQPMVVLGIRGERQERDSAGEYERGATVGGGRVGIRAGERAEAQPISALEFYVGVRNIPLRKPSLPDVGIDLVAGWGNIGVDTPSSPRRP